MKLKEFKGFVDSLLNLGLPFNPIGTFPLDKNTLVDLKNGTFTPERNGDSIQEFYEFKINWFRNFLKNHDFPMGNIKKAIIKIQVGRNLLR